MKKLFFILLLMLFTTSVYADTETFYYDKERVEDMWITKVNSKETRSAHPYLLKRRKDNAYIYCLEPFVLLKKDVEYVESEEFLKYGLDQEQIDRINLLIYYGYGYKNHTSLTWYGVTQYLIWQEVDKEADIYFTKKKNGERANIYQDEINEIETLILEHKKEPDFLQAYTISTNSSLTINSNIMLDNFDIITDAPYHIDGNKLLFNNLDLGHYDIKLVRKDNRFKTKFAMYYNDDSQNVIVPGTSALYEQEYQFSIDVLEGKLQISKVSSSNNKTLKGAEYGVYQDDTLMKIIKTDDNGVGEINLPFGEYIIKELVAPPGYKLDVNEYTIIVDKDNLDIKITLYDDEDIVEVPDTGLKDYYLTSISSIILGSIGLIYAKKKSYVH